MSLNPNSINQSDYGSVKGKHTSNNRQVHRSMLVVFFFFIIKLLISNKLLISLKKRRKNRKNKDQHMVRKLKDKNANDRSTNLKTPVGFGFVYYQYFLIIA